MEAHPGIIGSMEPKLGVLGGMGPLATADFLRKLTEATTVVAEAKTDQEHIPLIVYGVPQIPDRSSAIQSIGPSPLEALSAGIRFLADAGVQQIAIPCNTAHYWFEDMARALRESRPDGLVPNILHIVDAVHDALRSEGVFGGKVGLLATAGTIDAQLYPKRLTGYEVLDPTDEELRDFVKPGIEAVKAGQIGESERLMEIAAQRLLERGARKLILGCTEIPLALPTTDPDKAARYIDSTNALALACVAWWKTARPVLTRPAAA